MCFDQGMPTMQVAVIAEDLAGITIQ